MNKLIPSLKIKKIAMHGYGIGYAENKAILVPYTLPGDVVDVQLQVEKKDVAFATLVQFRTLSEDRIAVKCEAFDGENACGGCDWLMVPYYLQLQWKSDLVKGQFAPLQLQSKVTAAIASPSSFHYRNKSFLPAAVSASGIYFGMYERYSHRVIPHTNCLLHPKLFDDIFNEIAAFADKVKLPVYNETNGKGILRHAGIRINQAQEQVLVVLVTKSSKFPFTQQLVRQLTQRFPQITGIVQNINRSSGNVILGHEEKILYGSPYLYDELDGVKFRVHYKSFFQVNSPLAQLLYGYLKAQLQPTDIVLDAFCGNGSIGLYVADKVKQVIGIETDEAAVADAEFNRELNQKENVSFRQGTVEELLPSLIKERKFSTVIFDPPRKGVDEVVLQAVVQKEIPLILYVSCNPMTLVRDVSFLLKHGYKAENITPFDMFPQTWHIETVVKLTRISA